MADAQAISSPSRAKRARRSGGAEAAVRRLLAEAGVTLNGPEPCDNGSNNVAPATAYGPGVCTTACAAAPRCGDGVLQTQFGEQCDGSKNCTSMCTIYITH